LGLSVLTINMKGKKILKLCFWANSMFSLGGEQRVTTTIVNELVNRGYDITVVIKYKEQIDRAFYGLDPKVKIIFMHNDLIFNLNTSKFLSRLRALNRYTGIFKSSTKIIRRLLCCKQMRNEIIGIININKFDVVIGVGGDRSFILADIKEKIDSKIIGWHHMNVDTHFKNKFSRYYNEEILIEKLFLKFDNCLVLTDDDNRLFKKHYGFNATVMNNPESFSTDRVTTLKNKKFIAIGRLTGQKGFDLLIEASYKFYQKNKDWSLSIFGEGRELKRLNKLISHYRLSSHVKILPPKSNIQEELLNSSIYLMSSRWEGLPLVVVEALGCGLPVVAFDLPANKEMITNNYNGILVKKYDVDSFCNSMLKIANEKDLLERLSNNCKKSVQKYSVSNIINKWICMLNTINLSSNFKN